MMEIIKGNLWPTSCRGGEKASGGPGKGPSIEQTIFLTNYKTKVKRNKKKKGKEKHDNDKDDSVVWTRRDRKGSPGWDLV